jgi:hypothetical protein
MAGGSEKEHFIADKDVDFVGARGNNRYMIEVKAASESGRIGSCPYSRRPSSKHGPTPRSPRNPERRSPPPGNLSKCRK